MNVFVDLDGKMEITLTPSEYQILGTRGSIAELTPTSRLYVDQVVGPGRTQLRSVTIRQDRRPGSSDAETCKEGKFIAETSGQGMQGRPRPTPRQ